LLTIIIGQKCTQNLLEATREVSLEVNTEKMEYIFMSHHQSTGQNHLGTRV